MISKNRRKKWIRWGIIAVIATALVVIFLNREDELVMSNLPSIDVVVREGTYAYYRQQHEERPFGTTEVEIDLFAYISGENVRRENNFEGESSVLITEENSHIEFEVTVPSGGMYHLYVEYFPMLGRGIAIDRAVKINGESPFQAANLITFDRVWGDSEIGMREDNRGNEIRPPQVELPRWESAYFRDGLGYVATPYQFFFEAGTNTITLTGVNEPMAIRRFALKPVIEVPHFADFVAQNGLDASRGLHEDFMTRIQGQHATARNSPSLFPLFDSSSGITDPPSASVIRLNMIGGEPWRLPGQWIEWEVEVPYDGLYRISFSARQSYNRGFVSSRTLTVNGQTPFAEVVAIPFSFNNSWELITLSDDAGDELLFPLQAGTNRIRMEATLGDLGDILTRMLDSVYRLNRVYRQVLILTGPSPDVYRDYRLDYFLPDAIEAMGQEAQLLFGLIEELDTFTGERSEHSGMVETLARQLAQFYERPDRIPARLVNFRENISALGDAARILREGPLDIDFLYVSGINAELPVISEGFFNRASHELSAFAASFTMDFDNLGDVHVGDRVIDVWIPAGRDQANVLKSMIDDTFIPNTGIGVNLRLVDMPAILPAVVAGIGPDVALSLPLPDPVNFAMRNAAVDLSQFAEFNEVASRFAESAMVPFYFDGGVYALPETQNFSLMFYRTDILEELELEVPQTWDDVLAVLPTLQRNNMNIAVPSMADPMNPDISGFLTQLYQRGGFLYNDDFSRTILDNEAAIAAFDFYTRFFTHHDSPEWFNFVNRFRSGEMPIGFADFTNFNTLSVFAPEIQGLWNFALMPGYVQPDGRVDRTVPAWGTSAVMFDQSDNQDDAWEFLMWWTSAETQLRFGRELESVMGAAARFPTANLEAFDRLPWSVAELNILNEQRSWTLGTPEVPGGYYVSRHIINATRRVINDSVDTRETLLDFSIVINREMERRRRGFGLED